MTLTTESPADAATIERPPVSKAPAHTRAVEPYADRWRMLPVLLAAMFMAMFDFFVVNVAGPSLQHDLSASAAALELIISGYTFTYAAAMVTGGRLGDLFGQRRLFIVGMAAFTAASVLCGVAVSPGMLVTARLLQGLTAAAMVPQVLGMITAVFPPGERARALGWFGVTIGLGSVAGQVLGGVLLDADVFGLGWRTIFLVNLPIGLVAVAAAARLLPTTARPTTRPKLDPIGALGISAGIGLILVPLVLGRSDGWPLWGWLSFLASVPVLAATLWWEKTLPGRGGSPVINLDLLQDKAYSAGLTIGSLYLGTFTGFLLAVTLLLQGGLGLSPLSAGLTFGPLGIAFATSSIAGRGLAARHPGRTATAGAMISLTGMTSLAVIMAVAGESVTAAGVLASMILVGAGNGLAIPTFLGASLHNVPAHHAGAGAGMLTTTQQFGNATGVAVMGAVFFTVLGNAPDKADFTAATGWVAALSAVVLLGIVGLTFLLPRTHKPIG